MRNSGEAAEKYISSGGRTLLFALLFASCLAVAAAQAEDLIVDGTTFVLDGAHTYASVQIRNGGTLTHSAATPGSEYSLDLTVTGTLVIDATSTIDVSARGYVGGRTIGNVATGAASGRSGGSCGGRGFPWEGNPNQTYGDFRDPRYPGSGAAIDKVAGGIGGGVVRVHAATLLLDGSIRADGGNGPGGGGGGSGGSVYIVVDSLQGSGPISANGGKGDWECYYGCRYGGGGGGGRVALYYSTNNGFDLTRVTAAGGDNDGRDAGPGAAGTVYLKQSGHAGELRIVSPAADVGAWTPLLADDALESESVTIAGPGVMVVPDQDRPIIASDVTLQSGAVLSHLPATSTESHVLRLVVRNNLTIDAASKIDVSKRGYIVGRTLDNTTAGAASALGGGSYGGLGGGTSNYTYGDPAYPNELGSGGGPADGIGSGAGGGLVHVSARHASIDGAIRSDGADGNKPAGSGGGIVLNAGTLTGAGTISAAGGKGGTYCYYGCGYGGGGGGGRVAVYVWGANTFDPVHITATKGGEDMGEDVPGEDGTVVFPPQPFFAWAEPGSDLFHGTVQLVWEALATDPDTITAEISAVGSQQAYPLGASVAALGSMRWNTAAVPDGVYELRAVFHNQASQVIGTATRQIVVNNSVAWHAGRITANETWAANVVHVVEGNLAVTSGATLSIAPGAVIKFAPRTGMTIEAGATLSAPAAAIFTALADDTAGGDTNLDGAQSLPRRGDWDGFLVDATGQLNLSDAVERRFMRILHRGKLTASETWAAAFVHEIAADVVVPNGLTLTLEPGALVTFDRKLGITLETGSRLIAAGSVAQPITFTSIRDESFGGTAGSDASRGMPEAGDWRWIYVGGAEATLDHVEMRYGGGTSSGSWDQTGMIRTTGAASLKVTNSILRDAFFDGILAWGGTADVSSSTFTNIDRAISAHPGSPVHVVNCTVDGNRIGLLVHGGTMDVTNTIVSNSFESGVQYDFGTLASVRYSDVWAAAGSASVNYRNATDQTGSNGNISRDPHYVDREHANYRPDYRSPAIDAADGPAAPGTDSVGVPRYDDPRTPNTGIATAGGAYADMGAYEFAETADSNLDLIVSSVSGPTTAVAGDTVRVQWTVTNIGSGQVVGPWHDTVNLVLSPDANPTVIFAAEVLVGEGTRLGPGQSVSTSAEIRVPGSIVAEHRWQVVTNTRGEVFEGRNRENNTGLSLSPVKVDLPELVIGGVALSRQFDAVGQAHWFKFVPSAGQDVIVRLDRAGTGGSTELYIAQGYMPSRERFDARQNELNAPDVSTLAASTSTQTYYVMAYPPSLPGGPATFTISARALDFSLDAVGPQQVGNAGAVTLTLHGGQLRSDMTFEIVDAHGGVHGAQSVFIANSSVAYVTFDLSGLPLGTYTVRARDGAATATLTDGVNVIAGTPGSVQAHLTMPKAMRPDWTEPVTVDYVNVGNTDVIAPLMVLSMENAKLRLPGKTDFAYPTVQLLGINSKGPAGILPPGAHGTITLEMQPTASGGTINGKLWVLSDPSRLWDWNAVKSLMRPDFVPADPWEAIFANFTGKVGTTVGQYDAVLAADATYLGQLGEYTPDVQRLLAFELNQAGLNDITRRYTLGAFGRGAPAWWEAKVSTDAAGDVRIGVGSALRFFMRQADGSYRGVPGDLGALTVEGGAYRVREANGIVIAFQSNGAFDYEEDRLGRRMIATYSGNRVTGLADDTGDTVSYTYNLQGRIAQVTDAVGRITTLTYDATGELLAAVADAHGTTSFTYDTGQEPATRYAVRSIAFPDATHSFYDYDSRGRLLHTSGDGGAEAESYAYDAAGGVTVTDAIGSRVVALVNDTGQVARLVDALSNSVVFAYDDQRRPTRLDGPAGGRVSFQYGPRGNVAGVVDPMGQQIAMGYEATFNQLTALTNAAGHTIQYERDARGNVTGTTYPNGDREHFAYDADGNTTAWTNGRARTVHNTYDAHQLLTRQDLPDGSHREFTYDAHRNLTAATDARGTAHLAYDSADRLTQITYPSGRFLQFTYDAGGRRIRSVDQDGGTVKYAYDAVGRLASLTDGSNAPIVAYTYNTAGQLTRTGLGNGTYTTYEYDLNGQVLHLNNRRADSTVLSHFDYTYDSLGRRTIMGTRDGQWAYSYDASGQLTHAVFNSTNPAIANQDLTYEYDAAGNRVRTVQNGASVTYATNSADQYVHVGTSGYAYDADGNLISRGDGATQWTYTYDDENQLTGVAGPDGSWTYEYDVFGNRVAATHNGQRTEYLVDPVSLGNVVGTYDGTGALTARYVHGLGLVGRVDGAGAAAYYSFDALGSTSELVDGGGNVLNRYAYLPFGEPLAATESVDDPFQFIGEMGVMNAEHGLAFMRARYSHPATGRFTQRDPIGLAGGVNLYAYAGNSPTNASDPSGLMDYALYWKLLVDEYVDTVAGGSSFVRGLIPYISQVFTGEYMERKLIEAGANLGQLKWLAGGGAARVFLHVPPGYFQPRPPGGGGALRHIAGRAWQAVQRHPLIAAGIAGVIIGTGARRYIEGVDEAAQMTWVQIDDFFHGWVLWTPGWAEAKLPIVTSHDPNDIIGPSGNGTAHWIAPDQTLPYKIRFENDKQATAPAQAVRITTQLDPDLDYTTFQLGSFNFDGVVVTVPPGRTFYSERLDLRATYGLYLDISANLDFDTGIVTWVFASVDPVTGRTPRDPLTGFLPPNVTSPIGEGYVIYTIRPRSSSSIGTPISAEASIVFDTNDPIDTPQHQNPVGPIADCTGDCDSSGQVTVDELLTMVNIALGNIQVEACIAGDQNSDGAVTIDEILTAVNYALNGCPVQIATPPTPSPTRTTPPSPSVTVPPIVTATPSRTPTATATFTRSATATATRTVAASATPTASATLTPTRTPTQTVAASVTPSATPTRTIAPATVTPTPTRTSFPIPPTPTGTVGFVTPTVQPPLTATPTRTVSGTPATPSPTRTPGAHVYCDTLSSPLAIPDGNEFGISDQITIADNVPITALRVEVQIDHTWVGDLAVNLAHVDTLTLATLVFRPGEPPFGCSGDNIACTFDDTAATHADNQCADPPPAIAGTVAPTDPLSVFNGESSAGEWMLAVSDHGVGDTGSLVHWCVEVQ